MSKDKDIEKLDAEIEALLEAEGSEFENDDPTTQVSHDDAVGPLTERRAAYAGETILVDGEELEVRLARGQGTVTTVDGRTFRGTEYEVAL